MIVANARGLKWIAASDTKNDPVDGRKLALLARADVQLLKPVEHRTAEQQVELAVVRTRDAILRARTLLIQQCARYRQGIRCTTAEVDHKHLRETRSGGSACHGCEQR